MKSIKFIFIIWLAIPVLSIAMESQKQTSAAEQQLKEVIQGLSTIKIPAQGKAFYPQLDANPRISATMKRVLEQYLNPNNPFASLFAKKIEKLLQSDLLITTLKDEEESDEVYASRKNLSPINSVAFNKDGTIIASAFKNMTIKLWNIATENVVATLLGHTASVSSIAFSPDGKILASGSEDSTIKLWDATSFKEIITLTGHTNAVTSVAFSSDGKMLASGSDDERVKLWNMATYKEMPMITSYDSVDFPTSVAFSPDDKILASGFDDSILLWKVPTGAVIPSLLGHSSVINSVAFSPDGKMLGSGSDDKKIKLWNLATRQEIVTLTDQSSVKSIAFSPDQKILVSATGKSTIAAPSLKLWNMVSYSLLINLTPKGRSAHSSSINSVAFSPDGKILASGASDAFIKLWDMQPINEIPQFLKSLYADTKGIKKFLLLNEIFNNYEKSKKVYVGDGIEIALQPFDLYQPEAIELLKELPVWLQKELQERKMVRVFKRVG